MAVSIGKGNPVVERNIAAMKRQAAVFPAGNVAANEVYNFNNSDGGWPPDGTPSWVDVDFTHRFRFEDNPYDPLNPNGAGQVQFSINGGRWLGISTGTFGGLVFTWDGTGKKVLPAFLTTSSTTMPPLLGPGESFVGTSPKYADPTTGGGNYDDSSFVIEGLTQTDTLQFRFLATMFTGSCPPPPPGLEPGAENPIWDINEVQIKGVVECVPEPGTLALAGTGLIAGLGWYARRRRR